MTGTTSFFDDLTSTIFGDVSLKQIISCSFDIINCASKHEIESAVESNRYEIDKILIQLLALNKIKQHETQLKKQIAVVSTPAKKNQQLSVTNPFSCTRSDFSTATRAINDENNNSNNNNKNHNNNNDLKILCHKKLKEYISPIVGFGNENEFIKHSIGNDIGVEILSFVSSMDLHKSVSIVSKQFNKFFNSIKSVSKYDIDLTKHYQFSGFSSMMKEYFEYDKMIDVQRTDGKWVTGGISTVDPKQKSICVDTKDFDDHLLSRFAPAGSMTRRSVNVQRLKKLGQRSPSSFDWFVDVNLKDFQIELHSGTPFHVLLGDIDSHEVVPDLWRCGTINLSATLHEADKVIGNTNINSNNYSTNRFKFCQIAVDCHLIDVYEPEDDYAWDTVAEHFNILGDSDPRPNSKWLTVWVPLADADMISEFGSKSSLEEQTKLMDFYFRNAANLANVCYVFNFVCICMLIAIVILLCNDVTPKWSFCCFFFFWVFGV